MQRVEEAEIEAHFDDFIDQVSKGVEIVVTREGRAVARLVPPDPEKPADALARVKALRDQLAHAHPEAFDATEELAKMRGRG